MPRYLLTLLVLFFIGVAGGLWSQAFLLPSLAVHPTFQHWQVIRDWNARTQIVAPVEQVYIRENQAVGQVIQRVQGTVVGIQTVGFRQGSGLVYTSDGLLVTLSSLVPVGFTVKVYVGDQDPVPAQVLKRDVANNLALLKIEESDLPTAGFMGNGGAELGERVILVAKLIEQGEQAVLSNLGIVKRITEDSLVTSIVEQENVDGAPVFDVEGRVAGFADTDFQGSVSLIPSPVLRTFLGL